MFGLIENTDHMLFVVEIILQGLSFTSHVVVAIRLATRGIGHDIGLARGIRNTIVIVCDCFLYIIGDEDPDLVVELITSDFNDR